MCEYREVIASSLEETLSVGITLGEKAQLGDFICFSGDLGSGKTTLIKGIAKGALNIEPEKVSSPTFVYLNVYKSLAVEKTLFHFDLYRLKSAEEFIRNGFEEYLDYPLAITCVEWSERITPLLPKKRISIHLKVLGENERKIEIRRWEN